MRVLIVDDSLDKITALSELINELVPNVLIETAENISNAITLLHKEEIYNLAVIDLFLPIRSGEAPIHNGGGKPSQRII